MYFDIFVCMSNSIDRSLYDLYTVTNTNIAVFLIVL